MKNEWKAWTPEEDALLREVWAQPGALKWSVDKFPGRTINAIRFRGHRELGLPKRSALKASTYSWCEEVVDALLMTGFVGTVNQIADQTPASHQSVRGIIRKGLGKKYRIVAWEKRSNGSDWTPKWAWGGGESVPKPENKSRSETSKQYRLRKKLKQGQYNPFAVLVGQVIGMEPPKPNARGRRGAYVSRIYGEAA